MTREETVTMLVGPEWKHNQILAQWTRANAHPSQKQWEEYSEAALKFSKLFWADRYGAGYVIHLGPVPTPHISFTRGRSCILVATLYVKHMRSQPRVLFNLDPDTYRFAQLTKRLQNKKAQDVADLLLTMINERLGQLYYRTKEACMLYVDQSKKRIKE